jgi:hypothetical protein
MMAEAKKQGFVIRGMFVDTFNDVRHSWDKIHTPADQVMAGVIEKVADAFSSNALPEPVVDCLTTLAYDDDRDTSLLVALCWHLDQLWEGQGFYLSVRAGESALKQLGAINKREVGRWLNNRAENSHQPFRRRERAMLRFRRMRSLQKFAALHGSIHNHFNQERTLISRRNFKDRRTAALTG